MRRDRIEQAGSNTSKEPIVTVTIDSPFDALRGTFRGELIVPGDSRYADATVAFNLIVVQRPALVAIPVDVRDVITLVNFARAAGMQLAPQRTGHNAEPLGDLDDVILVRTDALSGVEFDVERRVARVGSGSKWAEVVPAASDLGLAAMHGSTPDVSVTGYSLGGGVGWYARKRGLSTNHVVAIELVTADGQLRRVDHDNDPELFWALRGGGGNFGIVTAIEVQLFELAEVYAGVLFFELERASEVLQAWREWTQTVPDEVTSVGRMLRFPPIPEIPEPMQGRNFAVVEAVVLGDEAFGTELLRPLRELGPQMDTFAMMPPVGISELHMDPPDPVPAVTDSQLFDVLTSETIDAFVAAAGPDSGSQLASAEIRHVGGALARSAPGNGALDTLDAEFMTFGVAMAGSEADRVAGLEQLGELARAVAPWTSDRRYFNFTEVEADAADFYGEDTYARLRAAKSEFDPQNVFRANHAIPGARS